MVSAHVRGKEKLWNSLDSLFRSRPKTMNRPAERRIHYCHWRRPRKVKLQGDAARYFN